MGADFNARNPNEHILNGAVGLIDTPIDKR